MSWLSNSQHTSFRRKRLPSFVVRTGALGGANMRIYDSILAHKLYIAICKYWIWLRPAAPAACGPTHTSVLLC